MKEAERYGKETKEKKECCPWRRNDYKYKKIYTEEILKENTLERKTELNIHREHSIIFFKKIHILITILKNWYCSSA